MLHELSVSVRRWAGLPINNRVESRAPLVRLGDMPHDAIHAAQADLGSLRGMTHASADTSECACPDSCERDHANE